MTNQQPYQDKNLRTEVVGEKKKPDWEFEWKHIEEIEEKDIYGFMETFEFPDLKELEGSLHKSGYAKKQIKELVSGLKTLPEYKRD